MRVRAFVAVVTFVLVGGFGARALAADRYGRLIETLERDESYKVRMQAIRVMSKYLKKEKGPPPERVLESLGLASNLDESYLVRGMAVVALGVTGDPRARAYVDQAMKDDEAFVRKQAKRAIERLDAAKPPPPPPPEPPPPPPPPPAGAAKRSLVVAAADHPKVEAPAELKDALVKKLRVGFEAQFGDRYAIDDGAGAKGYQLTGIIAERSVKPEGAKFRVTMVVRLTIATWPENHLREVLSAKASATSSTNKASAIGRLETKLLDAAVKRIVSDSIARIGGG